LRFVFGVRILDVRFARSTTVSWREEGGNAPVFPRVQSPKSSAVAVQLAYELASGNSLLGESSACGPFG
jgi:hypothetical protein